jgi:hypothetical protein
LRDRFLEQGSPERQREELGLGAQPIAAAVRMVCGLSFPRSAGAIGTGAG